MQTISYDRARALVRTDSAGFYSVEDVRAHAAAVEEHVAACRRDHGYVHMLVMAEQAVVQRPEVIEESNRLRWEMSDPRDRIAAVVGSMLARMQAARGFDSDTSRTFATEAEALAWLAQAAVAAPVAEHATR